MRIICDVPNGILDSRYYAQIVKYLLKMCKYEYPPYEIFPAWEGLNVIALAPITADREMCYWEYPEKLRVAYDDEAIHDTSTPVNLVKTVSLKHLTFRYWQGRKSNNICDIVDICGFYIPPEQKFYVRRMELYSWKSWWDTIIKGKE